MKKIVKMTMNELNLKLDLVEVKIVEIERLLKKHLWSVKEKEEYGSKDYLREEKLQLRREKVMLLELLLLNEEKVVYSSDEESEEDLDEEKYDNQYESDRYNYDDEFYECCDWY
jgi:hypothetical protein